MGYFTSSFQRSDVSTVIPTLATAYGWNPVILGWINSAFIWSYAAMQIPFGYLSERWLGARMTVSLGVFLVAVGGVFGFFLPNVELSIIARVLIGIGSAAIFIPANPMLARWFPKSKRGLQTGILITGGMVGTFLGSITMPVLTTGSLLFFGLPSIKSAFFVVSLPIFIVTLVVFKVTRNRPEDIGLPPIDNHLSGEQSSGGTADMSILPALRSSPNTYLLTVVYAGFVGGSSISAWLTLYLVEVYSPSNVVAALIFTIVTIAPAIIGQLAAEFLGDRLGHRRVVIYSLLASCLSLVLLTALVVIYGTISLLFLSLLFSVFTLFTSGLVNVWPLTTELFSTKTAGPVGGMMNGGGNLTAAVVTVISGYFIASPVSFVSMFVIGSVVMFVGFLAALFLPADNSHD